MATVKGLTAERMLEIEGNSIVNGTVHPTTKHLLLTTHDGQQIDAGKVEGPQGVPGMPAGSIMMWSALAIPPGWIEADGRAVSRVTYSDLFAIIGSQYGNGDGFNTFNVPDLRGRVVVGQDPADTAFDLLNKQGGAKQHTLSVNEMPAHNHSFTYQGSSYGSWPLLSDETTSLHVGFAAGDKWSPERPIALANTGGSLPHNILQPYRVFKYLIKGIGGVGELSSAIESALIDRVNTVELENDAIQGNVTTLQGEMSTAKADIVTLKSLTPSFSARLGASQSLSGTAVWAKVAFNVADVNQGNNYSAASSRFIAPTAGVYEFSFSVTPSTTTQGPGFGFRINNVGTTPTYEVMGYGVSYNTVGATRQFDLAAGDQVEVWWTNLNSTAVTIHSAYGGLFTGKKIR